jgi:hypothetical protein
MVPEAQQTLTPGPQFRLKLYESTPPIFEDYAAAKIPQSPSEWFCLKFPEQAELYGAPVLEEIHPGGYDVARINPVALNEDFFAGVLGRNTQLGHHVVFYQPEQQFYFYDARPDAYLPTTETKLMTYLSQLLIKCAQEMPGDVDLENLFTTLRSEEQLKQIVKRAKSMLLATTSFFVGSSGKRRMVGDEVVDPTAEPAYKLFVREGVTAKPDTILTVTDAYENFTRYCQSRGFSPIDRRYFKGLITEVIKEEFGLGLRKDLKNERGKYQNGWKGLTASLPLPDLEHQHN